MSMLLHLYFRNADGSIAADAWGMFAVGAWLVLGGVIGVVRPQWTMKRLARTDLRVGSFSARGSAVGRIIGLVFAALGIGLIILILTATPGKLY